MLAQYGENCMVQKDVVEKFKHGRKSLVYEERSDGLQYHERMTVVLKKGNRLL